MNDAQQQAHHLYFVYGSNMHPELIAQHCGSPELLGPARVMNYALSFFGHTTVWDGGEEAAVPQTGEEVWGALYRMTFDEADRLDARQGVRSEGCGPYFLFPVFAVDSQGVSHAALMYRKNTSDTPARPSDAQRDFITAAAEAQGVPDTYVEKLKKLDCKKARYRVPRQKGHDHWFSLFAWRKGA